MSYRTSHLFAIIALAAAAVLSFATVATARGGDRTGPLGQGQLTGRGAGYCAGYSTPGYQNTSVARTGIWGTGARGGGRGQRNIYNATGLTRWQRAGTTQAAAPVQQTLTKEQRLDALKTQAENLQKQLENLNSQIKAVESEK